MNDISIRLKQLLGGTALAAIMLGSGAAVALAQTDGSTSSSSTSQSDSSTSQSDSTTAPDSSTTPPDSSTTPPDSSTTPPDSGAAPAPGRHHHGGDPANCPNMGGDSGSGSSSSSSSSQGTSFQRT